MLRGLPKVYGVDVGYGEKHVEVSGCYSRFPFKTTQKATLKRVDSEPKQSDGVLNKKQKPGHFLFKPLNEFGGFPFGFLSRPETNSYPDKTHRATLKKCHTQTCGNLEPYIWDGFRKDASKLGCC